MYSDTFWRIFLLHFFDYHGLKLLIAGGCYDTARSRRITKLSEVGLSVKEIVEIMKMKVNTVKSYLPYEKVIYNKERCEDRAV